MRIVNVLRLSRDIVTEEILLQARDNPASIPLRLQSYSEVVGDHAIDLVDHVYAALSMMRCAGFSRNILLPTSANMSQAKKRACGSSISTNAGKPHKPELAGILFFIHLAFQVNNHHYSHTVLQHSAHMVSSKLRLFMVKILAFALCSTHSSRTITSCLMSCQSSCMAPCRYYIETL
jgi:hypothetical protein